VFFCKGAMICCFLAFLKVLRMAWNTYKKTSDLQGNMLSSWGITPETKHEKESSWVKVDYGKPQFDVTRQITSTKGESRDDSLRRLKGNVASLRLAQGNKFRTCRLLC